MQNLSWKYFKNRYSLDLLGNLVSRDLKQKNSGTILGVGNYVFVPFISLLLYTFVFGIVLRVRWYPETEQGIADFALILFSGLAIYSIFSDILFQSASLFDSNQHYVRKVVFRLELLPRSLILSYIVQALILCAVIYCFKIFLFDAQLFFKIYHIIIFVSFVIHCYAISLLVSIVCPFVRDVKTILPSISQGLLFLSPILYPTDMLPNQIVTLLNFNPITLPVRAIREIFFGMDAGLNGNIALVYLFSNLIFLYCAIFTFKRLKVQLNDVL